MDYPDDFDTSASVAGKQIAVSRTMAIWISVTLLLIVVCAFALPWLQKNRTVNPLVIYVNAVRGEWQIVNRDNGAPRDVPYYVSEQRAIVGIFTKKWFTISDNVESNEKMWGTCGRDSVCNMRINTAAPAFDGCDIYCLSGDSLYGRFSDDVLPLYRARESFGDRWQVDQNKIFVRPNGAVSERGGKWIVRATVRSNLNGDFNIIAYVDVARDVARFPQTLGYYIAGFNAYRE